jgi:predicted RND superfamily exporter protein
VSFDADVLSLLPRDGRVIPAFRQYLSSFGSVDHLCVVFTAPATHAVTEYAEEIDDWIDCLRLAPEVAEIDAGVADDGRNFSWLQDRELLLLGGQPLDAALERLSAGGIAAAVAPLVNRELARRFLPQFLKGLIIGTAIVVALVGLAFREWQLSLSALAPTVLGLVWAAGPLALARVELDLFALFAVVTFIGVGVDYGIHLVHRLQERGDAARAVSELAPVVRVAAAITLLGYGTLLNSSYPPLRSIGIVSAVSAFTLAAASVLVLPALLMGTRG